MKLILYIFVALSLNLASRLYAQTDSNSPGWQVIDVGIGDGIAPISYQDSNNVWAGGLTVLRSTDAGMTWNPAIVPNAGSPNFTSSHDAFLGSYKDTIFRTSNGGESWVSLHSRMPYTSAMTALSARTIHLAGLSWVGRSTDSGNTWQVQELGAPDLHAISFADSLHGFVVGSLQAGPQPGQTGGGFFRTTDGGVTWKQFYTGYDGDLNSVYAFNKDEVIVGGGNTLLRSTNGGATWSSASSGVRYATNAIDFSGRYGFAVGFGGAILASSDSGRSWYEQASHTANDLYAVKMFDSLHAIASGTNGTLLRTTNGGKEYVDWSSAHDSISLNLYPNPASASVQVAYHLPLATSLSILIANSVGQVVAYYSEPVEDVGDHVTTLDLHDLANGSYFLVLHAESLQGTATLTITR